MHREAVGFWALQRGPWREASSAMTATALGTEDGCHLPGPIFVSGSTIDTMSQLELVNRLTGNAVQPSGVSALVSHIRAWTFLRSEGILIVRYQPGGASLDSTKAARPFWRGLRPSVLNLSESNYANRKSSVHNKLCYLSYDDWTGLGKRSPRYRLLHEMIRRRRLCRSEGGIPQRPATQRPPEPALLAGQRDGDRPATAGADF
jgi:hypothetical protein